MKTRLIAVALALLPLLAAHTVQGAESGDTYFPLKPGMSWTYEIVSDKHPTQKVVVTNLPSREVKGTKVTLRKSEAGGPARFYLVGSDDKGIFRFGEQKSETAEPEIITPRDYYIRNPATTGTTWDTTAKMGPEEVNINLTIESTSDSVTVPAGTYKDCLKIKHVGGNKDKSLTVEAYEWYAPEVGLVKSLVTVNKLDKDKKKSSEHLTYQLDSFKP